MAPSFSSMFLVVGCSSSPKTEPVATVQQPEIRYVQAPPSYQNPYEPEYRRNNYGYNQSRHLRDDEKFPGATRCSTTMETDRDGRRYIMERCHSEVHRYGYQNF